ncbi:N-acetyl-gamma-glutamyl-phosphate reductase [Candidatus Dojkabacteria bacterium]|uniref:N-acetyl-gamma-glutamyl-phosphate reductase n=1 Tax=Candidatus Dojkabacteria bacterium TaxID=2099670 RepID=A0A955L760_9BACT|nr:N-acetyl-gamma-glutamyl-phosphate reductase [Candidatus Dojkabacteria bacterium]
MLNVSIVGGSGFGGGELLRILLNHPNITIKQITSQRFNRFPVTLAHPNLRGATQLKFSSVEDLEECDILFLALPNGVSQKNIEVYKKIAPKIIDLGADFRLKDEESYTTWYGTHSAPELLSEFTYGIAELHREELRTSNYVACGGCEATCSILTLYPLVKSDIVKKDSVVIDAKIGSSAAGNKSSSASHHPIRSGCLRSYKPTMHRHTAEIEQELGTELGNVHVTATAVELVRGILVTVQVFFEEDISEVDLWKLYHSAYQEEPFIRLITDKMGNYRFPEPKLLAGTNYCDIGIEKDQRSNRAVIVGAIDNLTKGTAGQAVQAMNIMHEWDERLGLEFNGLHPV